MGVSAQLLINPKYNVKNVATLLEGLGILKIEEEHKGDYSFLRFGLSGERRQMYVAQSTEYGGVPGTILSMGSNDDSIELLTSIAKVVGGFLQPYDNMDDEWQAFQSPHDGNSRFVLDHVILSNAITGSDDLCDKVIKATGYSLNKN